jgi:hypothetical protein
MEPVCSFEMSAFKHVAATKEKPTLDQQQQKAENLYMKEE